MVLRDIEGSPNCVNKFVGLCLELCQRFLMLLTTGVVLLIVTHTQQCQRAKNSKKFQCDGTL